MPMNFNKSQTNYFLIVMLMAGVKTGNNLIIENHKDELF